MTAMNIPAAKLGLRLMMLATAAGLPGLALAEEYRLGVQDRVRVHVSEWPAINGEVTVGAGGQVSLPVIGEVAAKGLTTAGLAAAIAEALKEKANLPQAADTAVDIVAYRPFYILGNVTAPGEYSYRPGMIVLNAVSLAGGVYRSERGSQWEIERTSIASRGELAVLDGRSEDLRASKIRFEAELSGAAEFPPIAGGASPQAARAWEEQRAIFEAAMRQQLAQKSAIQTSMAMREKEVAALDQQSIDLERKLAATQAEVEQVRELAKRDLAVNKLFPLERTLADVQREQQDLEISKLRTRQEINLLARSAADMEALRRNEALTGVQRVNAQLREVEEQRSALLRLLDGAAYYSATLADGSAADAEPRLCYTIVRGSDYGNISEIAARESSKVEPGDIVKVSRISASAGPDADCPDEAT